MSGLSLSLQLGHRRRRDLYVDPVTPLTDWGNVAYSYVTGSYIGNNGTPVVNANFRHVIVPVESYWQGIRVAGAYNMGATLYFAYFLNDANTVLGSHLIGTGGNVTLSASGNGILPALPTGTTKIALNQRTTNTAFTIEALNTRVLVIGDSTSSNSTSGIGDDLATLYPTRTFYQQGIGGQLWVGHIRKRMGINAPTVIVTGGEIPTSGTVACTPNTSFLVHQSSNICCQVRINGVRCALRFTLAGATYSLEALDTISSAVTVADGTAMTVLTGWVAGTDPTSAARLNEMLSGTLWIVRSAPSINDKSFIDYPVMEQAVDDLIAYASRYRAKLVLVGMMNGEKDLETSYTGGTAPGPVTSYNWLTYINTMNAYMATKAAENPGFVQFVDILQEHIANNGSTTELVNGTNFEVLTNQAVSVKLSDYRHETTTVQSDETAPFVKASMGW